MLLEWGYPGTGKYCDSHCWEFWSKSFMCLKPETECWIHLPNTMKSKVKWKSKAWPASIEGLWNYWEWKLDAAVPLWVQHMCWLWCCFSMELQFLLRLMSSCIQVQGMLTALQVPHWRATAENGNRWGNPLIFSGTDFPWTFLILQDRQAFSQCFSVCIFLCMVSLFANITKGPYY